LSGHTRITLFIIKVAMELVSYLKITSEPIHARKGKLAPINPLKCKRQELKIRGDLSPKVQGLPKIHTLNHS